VITSVPGSVGGAAPGGDDFVGHSTGVVFEDCAPLCAGFVAAVVGAAVAAAACCD
jgi:hypothetical protein